MEEKKHDKRLIAGLVVGVITVLTLVIGATYAYFSVSTTNSFGTSTISSTAETVGSISLIGNNATLNLNLSGFDMMIENAGYYYATEEGIPNTDYYDVEIGHTSVTGSGYYNCNYTLNITASASSAANNLYTAFQGMSGKSTGQIYLSVVNNNNTTDYDFNTANLFPITVNGTLYGLSANNVDKLLAIFVLNNKSNLNQNALQGKDITLTVTATNFSCTALDVTYEYWTSAFDKYEDNTVFVSGSTKYYIKSILANNSVVTNEVCGLFNGTEVCLGNNWNNASQFKSQMEAAGATCNSTYLTDEILVCTDPVTSLVCSIASNNDGSGMVSKCKMGTHYCYIGEGSGNCGDEGLH